MKPEKLLYSLNDLNSSFLQEAHEKATITHKNRKRRFVVLIAATMALMALTLTAFAAEDISSWFQQFFHAQSEAPLSPGQIEYLEQNEQIFPTQQEAEDSWRVSLRSALTDGEKAYLILGITAPNDVSLEQQIDGDHVLDRFGPGNVLVDHEDLITPSVSIASVEGNFYYAVSTAWREDGDGLSNTKNLIVELDFGVFDPSKACVISAPFAPEIGFDIHIENIVRKYEDEAYRQSLLSGKYAGQTDVMFTSEETQKLYQYETLAEGVWDFTVHFEENTASISLLDHAVSIQADVWKQYGNSIADYDYFREEITVTSITVRPLSVTLCFEPCSGGPTFSRFDTPVCVVMKDGTTISLRDYGSTGTGSKMLEADSPIVLEDVTSVQFPDGTQIRVP